MLTNNSVAKCRIYQFGIVYRFKADLPGVEEKDVEVTLTGNRLTVSGKREAEERHESDHGAEETGKSAAQDSLKGIGEKVRGALGGKEKGQS